MEIKKTSEIYSPLLKRKEISFLVNHISTGTPKLLRGIRELKRDSDISVIVNTAEDIWMSGNHVSPDIDTVIYLFAGILNTETWWGITNDSFITHHEIGCFGGEELLAIGDRDRATHIVRGAMLNKGDSLTESTKQLCQMFGIEATILPMTDTPISTMVSTPVGLIHFQEYWVKYKGQIHIENIQRKFSIQPKATQEVLDSINNSDGVIIGPSNPITSIMPILECSGIKEALSRNRVLAISPFIGKNP
jgi:LPPG:FO 2-phospho-L-lactate transferase